jgi:hypothetical protein
MWGWILSVAVVVTLQAACTSDDAALPSPVRQRSIAFDNIYGNVTSLTVHVTVDGGPEQTRAATCGREICTFRLTLTHGSHDLVLAVEQHGQRSEPTSVTIDTTKAP